MSERRKQIGIGFCLTILVALFVLYVLSIGPAIWLVVNLMKNPEPGFNVIEAVYSPLDWIFPDSGPTADLFNRYVDLWLDFDIPKV